MVDSPHAQFNKSNKRTRFANFSGSSSELVDSQEPDRSTPSFNYASSRCVDSSTWRDQLTPTDVDLNVRLIWLEAGNLDRFLLVEDSDTGDILMPLSRLKDLLGDNYSRCLNSADSRYVVKPERLDFGIHDSAQYLYWRWPFESPTNVKSAIKHELSETSMGHIRLVPVPVVHSAMSKVLKDNKSNKKKADARVTPVFSALFKALDKALRGSSYAPTLHSSLPAEDRNTNGGHCLFKGPHNFAFTAAKYMTAHAAASRKKAVQDAQAACQKQQEESTSVVELIDGLSALEICMSKQAKKLEKLEETLEQTKSMFAHLFQLFSTGSRTDAFSQAYNCLTLGQGGNPAYMTGRYSNESTPKSENSRAFHMHGSDSTPSQATCTPFQFAALRRQHSTGCMPAVPVQGASFPAVANKSHHLGFAGLQTQQAHSLDAFLGRDKQGLAQTHLAGHVTSLPDTPFGDCAPHSLSYQDLHDPRSIDTSYLS